MVFSRISATIIFLLAICIATICLSPIASAEITIKVVDPQDAVVAGAEVQFLKAGKAAPAAVQTTSAEGLVSFRDTPSTSDRLQVLAPGFAAETVALPPKTNSITIKLHLPTAAETVVVTATRTPVPSEAAGADVDTLSSGQLDIMQPVAADDAIRFLP